MPASLQLLQSIPFVAVRPGMVLPTTHCLPLFRDGVGLRHFFSGNQRGSLFLVLTLQDASLPRFLEGYLDAGVSVRCWCDSATGGSSTELKELFELDCIRASAPDTLCVRLNLQVGKDKLAVNQLVYFHLRVQYQGVVVGIQSDRMRILSKPRRLLIARLPFHVAGPLREHWPALRHASAANVGVLELPGSMRTSGSVPAGFEAPLHRALLLAMLHQVPESDQMFVLDFLTTALCAHFLDEHLIASREKGIFVCLVPRRPRPDPSCCLHYAAMCIMGPTTATAALPGGIRPPGSIHQWVHSPHAAVKAGTTHGEEELLQFVLAAHYSPEAAAAAATSEPRIALSLPSTKAATAPTATSASTFPPGSLPAVTGGQPDMSAFGSLAAIHPSQVPANGFADAAAMQRLAHYAATGPTPTATLGAGAPSAAAAAPAPPPSAAAAAGRNAIPTAWLGQSAAMAGMPMMGYPSLQQLQSVMGGMPPGAWMMPPDLLAQHYRMVQQPYAAPWSMFPAMAMASAAHGPAAGAGAGAGGAHQTYPGAMQPRWGAAPGAAGNMSFMGMPPGAFAFGAPSGAAYMQPPPAADMPLNGHSHQDYVAAAAAAAAAEMAAQRSAFQSVSKRRRVDEPFAPHESPDDSDDPSSSSASAAPNGNTNSKPHYSTTI